MSELDASMWTWKTELSYKYSDEHVDLLELKAVLATLKWLMRSKIDSNDIGMHLVDSQVSLSALSKGRSPKRSLNGLLMRIHALKICVRQVAHLRLCPQLE